MLRVYVSRWQTEVLSLSLGVLKGGNPVHSVTQIYRILSTAEGFLSDNLYGRQERSFQEKPSRNHEFTRLINEAMAGLIPGDAIHVDNETADLLMKKKWLDRRYAAFVTAQSVPGNSGKKSLSLNARYFAQFTDDIA